MKLGKSIQGVSGKINSDLFNNCYKHRFNDLTSMKLYELVYVAIWQKTSRRLYINMSIINILIPI